MRPSARARPSEPSSAANPISRNSARTTSPLVASNPIPSRARPRVATSDLSPNPNDIAVQSLARLFDDQSESLASLRAVHASFIEALSQVSPGRATQMDTGTSL